MRNKTLTIASACYQLDYEIILNSKYGKKLFYYDEHEIADSRMLVINNVENEAIVRNMAERAKRNNIIDEFYFCSEASEHALADLGIRRETFVEKTRFDLRIELLMKYHVKIKRRYDGYISSIPAIVAISQCTTDYLLYFDEDAYMYEGESRSWIENAIELMENEPKYVVANPIWNSKVEEAENESLNIIESFYVSQGFSNQCFLVNVKRVKEEFDYNEKPPLFLKKKYPYYAGNCFERRFATFMFHHDLYRLVAMGVNYFHEDFTPETIEMWKNFK